MCVHCAGPALATIGSQGSKGRGKKEVPCWKGLTLRCPTPPAAHRKRPLLPNIGALLEEEEGEAAAAGEPARRSEGGLLGRKSEGAGGSMAAGTGSPPTKVSKKGGWAEAWALCLLFPGHCSILS